MLLKSIVILCGIIAVAFILVAMYCCLIVEGRSDDATERYLRENKDTDSSDCNKRVQSDNY